MKRQVIIAGLAMMMFGGLCIMENGMVAAKPAEPESRGTSSIYMLAGEFRTVFANLLWIKVDQYHHEYLQKNSNWSQNTELIGMLEMIVALDPHFVEAYSVGATLYSRGKQDNQKAMMLLMDGIRHNPKAWELHRDAAIVCARHLDSVRPAQRHAHLALQYCDDSYYIPSLERLVQTLDKMEREQEKQESRKAKRP